MPLDAREDMMLDGLLARVDTGERLNVEDQALLVRLMTGRHCWPDRKTAADEIREATGEPVTMRVLIKWRAQNGLPIPIGPSEPIPMGPVWQWWATEKRKHGGQEADDTPLRDRKIEREIELLDARLSNMRRTTVELELVRSTIGHALERLKEVLLYHMPSCVVSIAQKVRTEEAVEQIREEIRKTLNDIAGELEGIE